MPDLLVSVLAAALIAALGLAALAAVTLAPFVVALQAADARHRSATRWGAAALAGSGVALVLAAGLLRAGAPASVAGLVALLAWVVPAAGWRSTPGERVGAHR